MVRKSTTKQKALTREVLVKELRASEQRIDNTFNLQTESLKEYIHSRISQINRRFGKFEVRVDTRFNAVDARFNAVDGRFDAVDGRFDAVDGRFDAVDARFDAADRRFDKIETKLDVSVKGIVELIERRSGEIADVERRLTTLKTR